nr:hypothetical protein [Tanacetum cinerariifolium]
MDMFNLIRAPNPTKVKTRSRPRSTRGGKSLAAIELGMASTRPVPVPESALAKGTAAVGDPESENASFASVVGSPESIYRPEWGVANGSMLGTPEACQDLVDHVASLGGHGVATVTEVGNNHLSQQVATLQEQVSREEKLKAAFEEFKQYEDNCVEQRCAKMDARLDALSIDFDEELYPHMLTAIACHMWMIGRGLYLAVMKCGKSLKLRQAFADVDSIEAYDPEVEAKYIAALQALKDLKYPLVDQLEGLKDTHMDVIMVALYLESDIGDDVPQQKKKKCRIVCRTHGVGSAHHARSDGVPVSVPTIVPQGLAILLADAATQTKPDERVHDAPLTGLGLDVAPHRCLPCLLLQCDMDLFNLIRAPNPTKVKTGSRPRTAHEVPLITVTANRVIEMEDATAATDSSGAPSTIKRSSLDFANEAGVADQGTMALEVPPPEDVPTTRGAPKAGQAKRVAATDPSAVTKSRKRGHDGVDANAPPKVLSPRPTGSTRGGKSLAAIELGMASTRPVPVPESAPADVSDPDSLSFAGPRSRPRPTGSTRGGKSLAAIELGMASTRPVLVPESAPAEVSNLDPLSFADPRSRHPADVAQSSQGTAAVGDPESKNASFASVVGSPESIYRPEWGVANGSMLGTPEACQDLVDHVAPPVARRDKRIQAREHEIKNLEALLEADADMKKATEEKNLKLSQELENMRALFSNLQVGNNHLSQQVATLQEQVSREEKLKAAFEEFKQYEDNCVEQRCAKMDARLDALSIDFDEELYPHMLTAIACHMWMIGHGLYLAVMKCAWQAQLSLDSIEAYDPEAEAKYIAALQALKDLKYPLVDQLEGLKDTPMDVIMAALYLESDIGDDVPQQKKKKCRIVCRTHGVGSAHHARSDGVPVSVPTIVPQGLTILLADAATQTKPDEYICTNSVLHAPWESLRIPNVLGMALRTQTRSRRSSNRSRFRRSSSSLFTMSAAVVWYVGIPISVGMTASVP